MGLIVVWCNWWARGSEGWPQKQECEPKTDLAHNAVATHVRIQLVEIFVYHIDFGWRWWSRSHENCRNHHTIQTTGRRSLTKNSFTKFKICYGKLCLSFCFSLFKLPELKWKVCFAALSTGRLNLTSCFVCMFKRQRDTFYQSTVWLPSFYICLTSECLSFTPLLLFPCITWKLYYRKMLLHEPTGMYYNHTLLIKIYFTFKNIFSSFG